MAESAAEFSALTGQVRARFAIPPTVTKSQYIYERICGKLEALKNRDESIPADLAVLFDTWKKKAIAMGHKLSDAEQEKLNQPKPRVVETTLISVSGPPPVGAVIPQITEAERAQLNERLVELSEQLQKDKVARRQTFIKWVTAEAGYLEEAFRIHERLGLSETNFWLWAEDQTGYHKHTVRTMFQVRLHLLDWPELAPLPDISMGMLNEIAQIPEPMIKSVLLGEKRTKDGKRFDEIPIRSVDPTKTTLRNFVAQLTEEGRQTKGSHRAPRRVGGGEGPPLNPRRKTGPTPEEGAIEPEEAQAGIDPELLDDSEDGVGETEDVIDVTRKGHREYSPRGGQSTPASRIGLAMVAFRHTWNSEKKDLIDRASVGQLEAEDRATLSNTISLAEELVHVLKSLLSA